MSARPESPLGRRFTLPDAAAYLGRSTAALEGLVRRRAIAFHLEGGRRHFFFERELDAYLASTRVAPVVRSTEASSARFRSVAHVMPATRELA